MLSIGTKVDDLGWPWKFNFLGILRSTVWLWRMQLLCKWGVI